MDNEHAWLVRRVVLSVLFLLIVAIPLYPELFGLDEVTPFAQLVAFRPQGLAIVLLLGLLMLIRERRPELVSLPEAQADVREEIRAQLQGLAYQGSRRCRPK
jgi:hypothetical protein